MPSNWGKRHGLPGYDEFRIGLSWSEARQMVRLSEKHTDKHKSPHDRRHTVLGFMHEIKLQLYYQAVDAGLLDDPDEVSEEKKACG